MAITVKHLKVSAIPDETDTSLVRPSDWNADHVLTGTIPIINGGTGQTTANLAFNALAPSQTGNTGKYLTTDGTDTSWSVNPLGTVTSITAGTGLTGGTITISGTIAIDSTVATLTGTQVLTNKSISGTTNTLSDIANASLINSAITINGTSTSLGGSISVGTVTSITATAGTGISVSGSPITTSGTLTITNTAPDQTVAIASGTGISVTGTYPSFTVTNTSPSLGGDVVGPASATDNAIARYNLTTGKLIQNSLVIIDDTGSVTGVNALTAQSLTVNNDSTLGFSNADTLDVRARIISDLEPNANNAKDIGTNGRNWRDGFFGRTLHTVNIEITGTTSFDGSQGTSGQVLTSAGTGATPTWTTPTTGTVTSVSGTGTVSGISLSGTVTATGNLTLGGTLDLSAPPVIGGTTPNTITGTTITATTGIFGGTF